MATYDSAAVSDTVIAHQNGITLQQGRALRDNPIAMAEGKANAPKVQGQALGGVLLAHGNILNYGVSATSGVNRGKEFMAMVNIPAPTIGTNFQVKLSDDGGATWATDETVMTVGTPAPDFMSGTLTIDVTTGDYTWSDTNNGSVLTGTATLPAGNTDAIAIGSNQICGAVLLCLSGR